MANAINKSFKLTFMILGDSGAGKTNFLSTFMNKLFNIEYEYVMHVSNYQITTYCSIQ